MKTPTRHAGPRAGLAVSLVSALGGSLLSMWSMAALAAEARTNRIQIEYVVPRNPEHEGLYAMLMQHRALEKLQETFSPFRLPIDLTLRTASCDGLANAWYHRPTINVCYEYIKEIFDIAPRETTAAGITRADAMLGQFFYVFAHEMGHAVYDLLRVPVLGPEEDAADYFAVYIMLQFGRDQARRLMIGAAYTYQRSVRSQTVIVPLAAFSGAHSPPAQRFFNLMCLAYGADPSGVFADLIELGYLPPDRASRCQWEHGRLSFAFRQLVMPHVDASLARQVLDSTWLPDAKMPESKN